MLHDRSINTLQRSPFYKDIILVVGGWNFTIWKEGNDVSKSDEFYHSLYNFKLAVTLV